MITHDPIVTFSFSSFVGLAYDTHSRLPARLTQTAIDLVKEPQVLRIEGTFRR